MTGLTVEHYNNRDKKAGKAFGNAVSDGLYNLDKFNQKKLMGTTTHDMEGGQAPGLIKAGVGLLPPIAVADAYMIFVHDEDIFGEKPEASDKIMAGIGVVPFLKPGKALLKNPAADEVIDKVIQGAGFIYDTELIQGILEEDATPSDGAASDGNE